MKELKLTAKEFMLFRHLANEYGEMFQYEYKGKDNVQVSVSLVFCEAFGY